MRESVAHLFDEMQQKWDIFICFLKQQLREWLQNVAKRQSRCWAGFRFHLSKFHERGHQIQHKMHDYMQTLGKYLASLDVVPILPWLAVVIVCMGFGAGAMIYFWRRNRTSTDLVLFQVDYEQVDEPDGADAGLPLDAPTLERTSDNSTEESSSSSSGVTENVVAAAAAAATTPPMDVPAKTKASDKPEADIETPAVLISPEQKKPGEPALSPPPLELVFGLHGSTSLPRRQISSTGGQDNSGAIPTAGTGNAAATAGAPVGVSPFSDGATNNRDDASTGNRTLKPPFMRMENPYASKSKSPGKLSGSNASPVSLTQNHADAEKKHRKYVFATEWAKRVSRDRFVARSGAVARYRSDPPALGVIAPQASTDASSKTVNDAPLVDTDMVVPEGRTEKADTTINSISFSLKRKRDAETPKPVSESENGANDCQANKKRKITEPIPVDPEQD